ncbi:CMKLR1 [Mytilus edulis]|uniref:CMKLR1 n=1 Tax=Mytilus edulis TaxID=6550 RepID=A0A8S3V6X3_MYTED|nr:CMKLR1 [Mytilus edulis]
MCGFSSIFLLAVITLQRYLKVCRPFGSQLSLKLRRISLLVIFVLSVTVSAPFIIWSEQLRIPNIELNLTGYMCGINTMKVNHNSYRTFVFYPSLVIVGVMMELIILNVLIGRQMIIASKMFTVMNNVLRMRTTNTQLSASHNSLETSFANINSVSISLAENDLESTSNATNNGNMSTNCDVTGRQTNTPITKERISAAKRF